MGLLNYTTKIDPDKTAAEIARCLSMHGAQAVFTEYDPEGGYVSALTFRIAVNGQPMGFRLRAIGGQYRIFSRRSAKRTGASTRAASRLSAPLGASSRSG